MRLSRPCYDKPHRCPGWAGGGPKVAKAYLCNNGSIRTRVPMTDCPGEFEYPASRPFRFGHCTKCDTVTWPWITRKLSIFWWAYEIRRDIRRKIERRRWSR